MKITVKIEHLMQLPTTWEKAIKKYKNIKGYGHDIRDAKIQLKQINFEDNDRRTNYVCEFEITEGDYLYPCTETTLLPKI